MSDSSTGGALLQTSPLIANWFDDDALFNFFHDFIMGLTGLAGDLIIPRWQPEPPNIPTNVNWCAFGINSYQSDVYAAEIIQANDSYEVRRHETINLLLSFYGANPGGYARTFRDGMQLSQNRESLTLQGMGLIESGEVIQLPSLLKERWLKRADLPFSIRRQSVRIFAVLPLLTSQAGLNNEHYTLTVNN
jgi:hypothetical protein